MICTASYDGHRCVLAWDDVAHFRHFTPEDEERAASWVLLAVHLCECEDPVEWPEAR